MRSRRRIRLPSGGIVDKYGQKAKTIDIDKAVVCPFGIDGRLFTYDTEKLP